MFCTAAICHLKQCVAISGVIWFISHLFLASRRAQYPNSSIIKKNPTTMPKNNDQKTNHQIWNKVKILLSFKLEYIQNVSGEKY